MASKPFLTLNLTETEARALLHAAEIGLTCSRKGDGLHDKETFIRLGSEFWPRGGGAETSAAVRAVKRLREPFASGCWYKVLVASGQEGQDGG